MASIFTSNIIFDMQDPILPIYHAGLSGARSVLSHIYALLMEPPGIVQPSSIAKTVDFYHDHVNVYTNLTMNLFSGSDALQTVMRNGFGVSIPWYIIQPVTSIKAVLKILDGFRQVEVIHLLGFGLLADYIHHLDVFHNGYLTMQLLWNDWFDLDIVIQNAIHFLTKHINNYIIQYVLPYLIYIIFGF